MQEIYFWVGAARIYDEIAANISRNDNRNAVAVAPAKAEYKPDFESGAKYLTKFLESEAGKSGLNLLRASKSHIRLAKDREGATLYFLDSKGLMSTPELGDATELYSSEDIRDPAARKVNAIEVVAASYIHDGIKPENLIRFIKYGLDNIADKVMESTK